MKFVEYKLRIFIYLVEPVSSVKPKLSNTDIKVIPQTLIGSQVGLICPAQGSPVPATRLVNKR